MDKGIFFRSKGIKQGTIGFISEIIGLFRRFLIFFGYFKNAKIKFKTNQTEDNGIFIPNDWPGQ